MEGELTPDGLVAFERLDESEQAIVRWLFTLSQDWPFTGHDIAGMILSGEHRDRDGHRMAETGTGSVHDQPGPQGIAPGKSPHSAE